ncbi:PRC-barrel domain-containing protein [Paenibacillus crassostreae]|uniref:Photosystem reaction center subunit H n=1 Tax=Paenibacillus crassostreae TaxID=1763538 RepID=A0A167CHU0_9BACL|nr:PRC-barrel domain-containing protein [Paenibacillus crassostreae]AOZ91862.1 photosystem reaction center subunit H [Paenibacillus crassostreae]OAB73215.1 photosystem reaction center subunit H [Paenibacillus crassostreae]
MKLQEMLGLPVFDIEQGKKIGKIHDFMLGNNWTILGIELERKVLYSKMSNTISWEDIIAYGEDAIMIRNQLAVRKMKAVDIQLSYALGKKKLCDLPVITEDGLMLGRISDVYFDQKMGNTIIGLEISDGFVTDIIEGRKWLPCTSNMIIGESSVLVPSMSEGCLDNAIHSVNG